MMVMYRNTMNTSMDGNTSDEFSARAGRRDIEGLACKVKSVSSSEKGMRPLATGFAGPGPFDVICARGKKALNHSGNRRFRAMIKANLQKYSMATSKLEKSLIVSGIVDSVREASPGGGFIKQENGKWYEVGDHIAREKCGQRYVRI